MFNYLYNYKNVTVFFIPKKDEHFEDIIWLKMEYTNDVYRFRPTKN